MSIMNKQSISLLIFALLVCCLSWESKKSLPYRRSDTGCSLYSKKIYVTGGCASDQVFEANYSACATISDKLFVYSPESDNWEILADMPRLRYRHSQVSTDGKIFLFGGVDNTDSIIPFVDIYDIAKNTWSTLSETFKEATTDLATFQIDKKIVLVGGYGPNYVVSPLIHYFDIPTQRFEYNVSKLNQARGDICVGVIDGKGYVYGGFQTDFCLATSYMEEYNFATKSSTQKANNNNANDDSNRKGDVGCFVINDHFYTVGGELKVDRAQSNCVKDASLDSDSYDPKKDVWTVENDLSLPSKRFRFCTVTYGNKVYRIGGQGPLSGSLGDEFHEIFDELQVYDFSNSAYFNSPVPLFALFLSILFYIF